MTKPETMGLGETTAEIREKIKNLILTSTELFILLHGGRNIGKTYTLQKTIIRDCIDNMHEFLYLVPTEKEKDKGALWEWVKKVVFNEFGKYNWKHTNDELYWRKSEDDDWTRISVCIPLSKVETDYKKRSYPLCYYMAADEVMTSKTTGLKMLINNILLMYETTDRHEDRVKCILLGNDLTKVNAIFDFFGITVKDAKQGVIIRGINKISWCIPRPTDLITKNDKFAAMVEGTLYGDMSAGKFDEYYGAIIAQPPPDAICTRCYGIYFGAYCYCNIYKLDNGLLYFENVTKDELEKYAQLRYVSDVRDAKKSTPVIPKKMIEYVRLAFEHGQARFVDEESLLILAEKIKPIFGINVM